MGFPVFKRKLLLFLAFAFTHPFPFIHSQIVRGRVKFLFIQFSFHFLFFFSFFFFLRFKYLSPLAWTEHTLFALCNLVYCFLFSRGLFFLSSKGSTRGNYINHKKGKVRRGNFVTQLNRAFLYIFHSLKFLLLFSLLFALFLTKSLWQFFLLFFCFCTRRIHWTCAIYLLIFFKLDKQNNERCDPCSLTTDLRMNREFSQHPKLILAQSFLQIFSQKAHGKWESEERKTFPEKSHGMFVYVVSEDVLNELGNFWTP